jgi:Di-sulfide bridge nucleocytoplasmic transport domain
MATPFRNPSFTTPRKPFDADLFSEASGADSSPADNADVDTPEVDHKSKAMTPITSGVTEKKPLFSRFVASSSNHTPGRGAILRGNHDAALRRVRKRRRAERDKLLLLGRRYSSDSDSDNGEIGAGHGKERCGNQNSPQQGWLASILTFIASKPTLPYILSYYPQLIFNLFISLFGIYLLISFYFAVQAEVNRESVIAAGAVIAEMAQCAAKYTENKCAPNTRLPALETACQSWETCMNRDPEMVGRARISARTFAEIFNNFIEPISWKAMVRLLSSCECFSSDKINIAFCGHPGRCCYCCSQPVIWLLPLKSKSSTSSSYPRPPTSLLRTDYKCALLPR